MQDQNKITPGEWFHISARALCRDEEGGYPASIQIQTEESDAKSVETVRATQADIQLMKAAPKLLSALESAFCRLAILRHAGRSVGLDEEATNKIMKKIKTALHYAKTAPTQHGHREPPPKILPGFKKR